MKVTQATRDYKKIKEKVQAGIQRERTTVLQLHQPDLLLPEGWKPVLLGHTVTLYKVVAAVEGRLVSVYDGSTEYSLQRWLYSKIGAASWPPLYNCFFCYLTSEEAVEAKFPKHSRCIDEPKVLVKVLSKGRAYVNKDGSCLAVSQLKLVSLLSELPQGRTQHRSPPTLVSAACTP